MLTFATRPEFVAAAPTLPSETGDVVAADGLFYRYLPDQTYIPDLPNWVPMNDPWAEHFGATTVQSLNAAETTTADNTPALQAALDYAVSRDGGWVRLRDGYYRTTSTLHMTRQGTQLFGNDSNATKLFADFTGGPVVHVWNGNCSLRRLMCLASSGRKTSTDVRDVGILFAVEDTPTTPDRLKCCSLEDVVTSNQPSHGVVINCAFTGTISRLQTLHNKGHGVVIDRGVAVPRTNLNHVPGLCSFNECQMVGNAGHGLTLGHPDDDGTTQALRVFVNNCEIGNNATDTAVRHTHAQVYCRATEVVFQSNVFTPVPGSKSSGVYIAGRCITLQNNRFIDVGHVALVGSYDVFPTVGVYIVGFNVISSPGMGDAVQVVTTPGQTSVPTGIVVSNTNFAGGVTGLLGTETGKGPEAVHRSAIDGNRLTVFKRGDQISTNGNNLVVDTDLRLALVPYERVQFEVTLEHTCDPSDDFAVSIVAPGATECRFCPTGGLRLNTNNDPVYTGVVANAGVITFGGTNYSHRIATLKGFVTNGSAAGELVVEWGAAKATPRPVVVYDGLTAMEVVRVV